MSGTSVACVFHGYLGDVPCPQCQPPISFRAPDTAFDYAAKCARLEAENAAALREVDELRHELACERSVLAMTVGRLGGMVEGAPTQRINFLQRIDELRRCEGELANILAARDTPQPCPEHRRGEHQWIVGKGDSNENLECVMCGAEGRIVVVTK